jgi:hypothetical protein
MSTARPEYDALWLKTVVELKEILRQNGLATSGRKSVLIDRISDAGIYRARPTSPPRAKDSPKRPKHLRTIGGRNGPHPGKGGLIIEKKLREDILDFILDKFNEDDFIRARDLESDWAIGKSYEIFSDIQMMELNRMDLPTLTALEKVIFLIQHEDMEIMDKESMGPSWSFDGFVLIEGKVVLTHSR